MAVAAGGAHTLGLKRDGTLWAWGWNEFGQLGDGTTTFRLTPAQVGSEHWMAAAAGDLHTVALRSDGTLWAWGLNDDGQLGDGTTTQRLTPVQVGTETDWASIAAGTMSGHTVALKADGTLWAWGRNDHGQLGDGTTTQRLTPARAATVLRWTGAAVGGDHTVAVSSDGTLWTWGWDAIGQLGDGISLDQPFPEPIP